MVHTPWTALLVSAAAVAMLLRCSQVLILHLLLSISRLFPVAPTSGPIEIESLQASEEVRTPQFVPNIRYFYEHIRYE